MKQLREHIKKEIKSLMEANYPAPPEIVRALKDDLKLRPLIRYVSTLKAVNSVPPSYRVFFHNNQFIDLYIEQTSIVAKIGPKSYWLMNGDETAEAIKAMNRVLTQPIPTSGNAEDEDTKSGDTGEADAEMEPEAGEDEGGEEEA
tara:strand:- start:142 stop:576 length:435 start_codon:yes stop_codon:yes gene_type:complete